MSEQPNPSYIQVRRDMMSLVRQPWSRLLDVGCARGATAHALRQAQGVGHTIGVELDAASAQAARGLLDEVLEGDAVTCLEQLVARGQRFDLVMCGDVLEHLVDPWRALALIRSLCEPDAQVIVSLPNVAHYSTIVALLRQRWPREDRGLHDRTHLRWFGPRDLEPLYQGAGFIEQQRLVKRRLIERPHPINARVEPLLKRLPGVRALTIFQSISLLRPKP